ncbi:hypothetical protein [Stutzerimonas stutzeri]|uniref:hypothetical protein n=2 Tax=Stutzerimonas stutzeri TaxID=316 RepID=UPI003B8122E0
MALKKSEASELAAAEAALAAEAAKAEEEAVEAAKAEEEAAEAAKAEEGAAEAAKAEEEAKAAEAAKAEAAEKGEGLVLVKVVNLTHSTLYQHSTGLSIGPKAEKPLLNDGWLANQLKARLLKRV